MKRILTIILVLMLCALSAFGCEEVNGQYLLDFCADDDLTARFALFDGELPIELVYLRDQECDIVVTDSETIQSVIEALKTVIIGDKTDICVCDAAFGYVFTMSDGEIWSVHFEANDIFNWNGESYTVLSLGELSHINLNEQSFDNTKSE